MTYSVILPTLNEKNHIIQLIEEIARIFQKLKKHFEIVVVDDNSSDGTIEILKMYENHVKTMEIAQNLNKSMKIKRNSMESKEIIGSRSRNFKILEGLNEIIKNS